MRYGNGIPSDKSGSIWKRTEHQRDKYIGERLYYHACMRFDMGSSPDSTLYQVACENEISDHEVDSEEFW